MPGKKEGDTYLRNSDTTLASQFFLRFLTRVWITQVRVEIFIKNFGSLFTEIPSFSPARGTSETSPLLEVLSDKLREVMRSKRGRLSTGKCLPEEKEEETTHTAK